MKTLMFLAALLVTTGAFAVDASDFTEVEGWTVVAVTTVDGDFEGCDFGKSIQFTNGWSLTCADYNYNYDYMPDAVIFAKSVQLRGRTMWMVKVLIDDEFYDMQPISARQK